jgi:hypothetical protein
MSQKTKRLGLFLVLLITVVIMMVCIPAGLTQNVTISNIQLRYDTGGNVVDAHDGRLVKFGNTYYLYGTAYGSTDGFVTTNHYHCYSSPDLTTWTFNGDLISNPPTGVYYRPHVIYNAASGKYILWYNWYATLWVGQYGVATCNSPTGPFVIQNTNVPMKRSADGGVGDEDLFVDDDGTAYITYTTISSHSVSIEKLSADYLSSTQADSGVIAGGCEACSMFKRNGIYYMLTDNCCCFCTDGSGARVYTASSPLGPYTLRNNINRSTSSNYPVAAVINGDRKGLNWASGGGWNDGTSGVYPDWAEVDFNGTKSITEIDVFTIQDNYQSPVDPTDTMTFSQYGITAFDVQYWNGSSWVTVTGGSVTGNNKVWRKLTFSAISTSKIRVNVTNSLSNYSRIVEIEAWASGTNVALASNGGSAVASSEYDAGSGAVIIHAQQTHIAELATTSGTAYIWMGDRWGSTPDGIKGHDFQYWSNPLQFDGSGNIATLSWVDNWTVDLATGPTPTPGPTSTSTPTPTATPTPVPGSVTNFFNQLYTGSRNNHTGYVGYQFTPGSNITITALGRAVSSGMSNSHAVKIWKVSDQSVVASVTVTTSSSTDSLGYKYEMLGVPVTLTSGVAYRIASNESAGGDKWMDVGSVSNHSSIATIQYGVHDNQTNGYPSFNYGSSEQGYVPSTFYTGNGPTPTPAPTATPTSTPQYVLDVNNTSGTFTSWCDIGNTWQRMQTFKPSSNKLTKVDFYTYKTGTPSAGLAIDIVTLDGSLNPVTVLYTATVPVASVPTSLGPVSIYPGLTNLTAGTKYGIRLKSTAVINSYGFGYNDGNLYPNGEERYSNGGTTWTTEANRSREQACLFLIYPNIPQKNNPKMPQ